MSERLGPGVVTIHQRNPDGTAGAQVGPAMSVQSLELTPADEQPSRVPASFGPFHVLVNASGQLLCVDENPLLIRKPGQHMAKNAREAGHRIARVRVIVEEVITP